MTKFSLNEALLELADAEAEICRSCKAPTEEGSPYCMPCGTYWADVDAGLWDDPWWDDDLNSSPLPTKSKWRSPMNDLRNMKMADLEFEGGNLVKVSGYRYNYMDGNQLLALIAGLGRLLANRADLSSSNTAAQLNACECHSCWTSMEVKTYVVPGADCRAATLVRAGLERAAKDCKKIRNDYVEGTSPERACLRVEKAIRAIADDPAAVAAIVASVGSAKP